VNVILPSGVDWQQALPLVAHQLIVADDPRGVCATPGLPLLGPDLTVPAPFPDSELGLAD
jgi:hypothetical protein